MNTNYTTKTENVKRTCLFLGMTVGLFSGFCADDHYGFVFDHHQLTLESGTRKEMAGPFYYKEIKESGETTGFPPLLSLSRNRDKDLDVLEYDFLYPLLTYDRFGTEFRWQFFQLLSWSGGKTMNEEDKKRFTVFPFYFQQRSSNPTNEYTAVFPFYGTLKNRLFRDEIFFAGFPLYSRSQKKGVTTHNYMFPVVHTREGNHLKGWQVWPFAGHEHKDSFTFTNNFGDSEKVAGWDKKFILWPFFLDGRSGLGTENESHQQALLPLYSFERSPLRDSTSYLWPLGLTITDDRARKYHEVGAPWPLVVFARGEGKHTSRVWPFYSHAQNTNLQSDFVLWPIYKYNRFTAAPLDRERTRILFFLYSDVTEKNIQDKTYRRRTDLWPLFTHKKEQDGNTRLQVLAPLEPLLPNNKSVERNYSPIWSIWRSENNPQKGLSSQSFLWNLYRHESSPDTKKSSFFFGMFQHESVGKSTRWKLFYVPMGDKITRTPATTGSDAGK